MSRHLPIVAVALAAALTGCRTALVDHRAWFEDASWFERGPWRAQRKHFSENDARDLLRRGNWIRRPAAPDALGDDEFRWRFVATPKPTSDASIGTKDETVTPTGVEPQTTWPARTDAETATIEAGPDDDPTGHEPIADEPTVVMSVLDDADRLLALAAEAGLAGWNAAILLARVAPDRAGPAVVRTLERLVVERPRYDPQSGTVATRPWRERWSPTEPRTPEPGVQIGENLQSAAAEAWIHVLGVTSDDPVEGLAPIGILLERRDLSPRLRAELYRGAARWIAPALLPHIDAAIGDEAVRSAPVELRRAAIEACAHHARWHSDLRGNPAIDTWPTRIDEARWDTAPLVRIAYGRWVARTAGETAIATLREQLTDENQGVRDAAIESLGLLGTARARDELVDLARRSESLVRAAAVAALVQWGPEAFGPFESDDSDQVRRKLAESLGRARTPSLAVPALSELVVDRNLAVERAAVEAVAEWPDELAVPVLLRGLEEGAIATRLLAHRAIRRRLPNEATYDRHAPLAERQRAIRLIARRLNVDRTVPLPDDSNLAAGDVERRRELKSYLDELETAESPERQRLLWDRLRGIDANEVRQLEELLAGRPPAVVDGVVRESLAEVSPVHGALRDLDSPDVRTRRTAARIIRDAPPGSLTPFVFDRLYPLMTREQDRLVWSLVHEAVREDGGDAAARLIQLTLEIGWPDLQALACDYVLAHPRPQRAAWLLPLFRSENAQLVVPAIRAAARCGNPAVIDGRPTDEHPEPVGLRHLATHRSPAIRNEAATALARLGDPIGLRELDRLARSSDADQRRNALVAMGETRQRAFVEPLVRAAREERDPRIRRVALASLEQVVDVRDRPRLPPSDRAPDATLRAWESWLDNQPSP